MNRMLCDRAQSMLSHSCVLKNFWAEAINTACYLVNRSPSTAIEFKTPFEVWSGSPADYSNLRIFGCPAYAHVRDRKLEPRAKKCIFLGYATGVKGYRLWCTNQKTPGLIISRDVTFNESASLDSQREKAIAKTDRGVSDRIELEIESPLAQPNSSKVEEVEEVQNIDQDDNVNAHAQQPYSIATGREKRVINRPQRFANVVDGNLLGYTNPVGFALAVAETVDAFECYSYLEAISSIEPNRRISAMSKEIESLNKFRCFLDLVDACENG
ncbi:uncharacterized protein LOC142162232 [Nicotiana tabacum]|uniref:Uncharacterized protein LOC142162232 n=1 Tax=Nicotiana tabacum TaxID=4097 RepID=A0AC58RPI7_TOBAC